MGTRNRAPASGLALSALNAVAAAALLRVFSGAGWLIAALGAAAGPHLIDAWAVRRARIRPAWITALTAAAGAAYCMVVVDPHTTFFWVPTTTTLASFARRIAEAPDVLRTAVVPVSPRGAALLLALLASWSASLVAIRIERSLDGTLAAVTPSLVLFVAVIALGSGAYTALTIAYATAVATYLLARNLEHLAGNHSWFPDRRHGRGMRRLATGGIAAGGLAVVLGALLGPALPGATGAALFDYRDLGEGRGAGKWKTVSPLVDIRGRLVQDPPAELFTVRTNRAAYWRLVALDQFDGSAWVLGETEAPPAGDTLPTGDAGDVGDVGHVTYEAVRQHFKIGPLASRWLPAAYRPTEIELTEAYVIEEVLTLVAPDDLSDGLEYEVTSRVATPEAADLERSSPVSGTVWSSDLELPSGFPARVVRLAHDIIDEAAAETPYQQAIALQDWLRDPARFTYTLEVPGGHGSTAIEMFLFDTRSGYCEQFAGSFAAMARAVGLPARVAVGFTPGTLDPDAGVYRVTSKDAHAWPEVYLSGVGWTAFEPTPGRFEPTPGDPTGTQAERDATLPSTPTTTDGSVATTTVPGGAAARIRELRQPSDTQRDTLARPDEPSWAERVLTGAAIVLAFALSLLLAYVALATTIVERRRMTRRRAPTNRERVTGAWDEAIDRLAEAGIERRPSSTPVEFALRHAPAYGAGEAGPPLMDLARLHTAAVFGPREPCDDDVTAAWQRVTRLASALRSSTRAGPRWRRRLDPRRLRHPLP